MDQQGGEQCPKCDLVTRKERTERLEEKDKEKDEDYSGNEEGEEDSMESYEEDSAREPRANTRTQRRTRSAARETTAKSEDEEAEGSGTETENNDSQDEEGLRVTRSRKRAGDKHRANEFRVRGLDTGSTWMTLREAAACEEGDVVKMCKAHKQRGRSRSRGRNTSKGRGRTKEKKMGELEVGQRIWCDWPADDAEYAGRIVRELEGGEVFEIAWNDATEEHGEHRRGELRARQEWMEGDTEKADGKEEGNESG